MPYRYRLTTPLLALSQNPYMKLAAKDKFTFAAHNNKKILFEAHEQLAKDIEREWTLNQVNFTQHLVKLKPLYKKQQVKTIVEGLFPKQTSNELLTYHCQNPTYLLGGNTLNLADEKNPMRFIMMVTEEPNKTGLSNVKQQYTDLSSHNNQIYLHAKCLGYDLLDSQGDDQRTFKNHYADLHCVLTKAGYQLIEQNTNSMIIYDLLMGVKPDSIEWFDKRNKQNWPALQKMFRILEPIFPDSYIEPLDHRIKNAFHSIFNTDNPHRSDLMAFTDWPEGNTPALAKFFRYVITGRFLNVIKNSIKLLTEFLPACIEEASSYLLDNSKQYLSKTENRIFSLNAAAAVAGVTLGSLFYTVAKITREVTMRITSPIRSAYEAYQFGVQNQGKVLGCILGGLSAIASIAGLGFIAILTAPLVAAAVAPAILSIGVKVGIALAVTSSIDQADPLIARYRQKKQTQSVLEATATSCEKLANLYERLERKPVHTTTNIPKMLAQHAGQNSDKKPEAKIPVVEMTKKATTNYQPESFIDSFVRNIRSITSTPTPALSQPPKPGK